MNSKQKKIASQVGATLRELSDPNYSYSCGHIALLQRSTSEKTTIINTFRVFGTIINTEGQKLIHGTIINTFWA